MQRAPSQRAAASRRATRQIIHGAIWLIGGFAVYTYVPPMLSYPQPIEWAMWGAMALGAYLVVMGTIAWLWTSNRR